MDLNIVEISFFNFFILEKVFKGRSTFKDLKGEKFTLISSKR